ncbi:hypothetical protein PTKIN_Ptkin07bG0043300 [Pterospermum kingtungense]
MGMADKIFWHFDKKGRYSVKSGYRVLCDLEGEQDNLNVPQECWAKLWKVDLPRKIKSFLWRVIKGILPVNAILSNRSLPISPLCPRRLLEPETISHALRKCPTIRDVWNLSSFAWDDGNYEHEPLPDWLINKIQRLNPNQLQEVGVALRMTWNERITATHGENTRPAQILKDSIYFYINKFNQAQQRQTRPTATDKQKWKPPSGDTVKVNFDSSYDRASCVGGIGIVIRNEAGEVMSAKATKVQYVDNPFLIEACTAIEALEFASECGFRDIVLEGDALTIIKRLLNSEEDRSAIAHQVEEGRTLIPNFLKCKIQHCLRNCNEAAHYLAKFSLTLSSEIIWIEECPNCIKNIVNDDVFPSE